MTQKQAEIIAEIMSISAELDAIAPGRWRDAGDVIATQEFAFVVRYDDGTGQVVLDPIARLRNAAAELARYERDLP